MDCSVCGYGWCWVCGSERNQWLHYFIFIPCQLINITALNTALPNYLRIIVLIISWPIMPLLFLLLFFFCTIMVPFCESKRMYKQKKGCHHIWLTRDRKCKFLGFVFIFLPFWILFVSFCAAFSLIITAILLIPSYILYLVAIIKMSIWWCQNKAVKTRADEANIY